MEFHTYTLYYTNEIQKNEILQTIKQYNTHVKENNMKNGELFHILHAKLKTKPFRMSMRDKRYCTCILGADPIGMIICCNIGYIDYTIDYFYKHKLACMEYFNIHSSYYNKIGVELININTI